MNTPRTSQNQYTNDLASSPTAYHTQDAPPTPNRSHSRPSSMHSVSTLGNSSRRSITRNSTDFGESSGGTGLGNLADELAGAWDEGDEDLEDEEGEEGDTSRLDGSSELPETARTDRDSFLAESQKTTPTDKRLSNSGFPTRSRQRRRGSDGLSNSDSDSDHDLTANLEARIAAVETLAKRGMGIRSGGDNDNTLERTAELLRDLGAQSGIESGNNRLTNAHSSLATYINSQSQSLHNLIFPLTSMYSPLTLSDPSLLDDLVPILSSLPNLLPRPALDALTNLSDLQNLTTDLVSTLSYLSDTLHITAQSTSAASRKLKATRDLVSTLRKQSDAADIGAHWIERGGWDTKLSQRDCARECEEVVGGFEEFCDGWRERLIAMNA